MVTRLNLAILAGVLLLVAACGATPVWTEQERGRFKSELSAGQVDLTCTINCIWPWLNALPTLKVLDASGQWERLALLVGQINYKHDLGYYYLGRAAEGLGLAGPARHYYSIGLALATSPVPGPRCRDTAGTCNDVDLLAVLPAKLSGQLQQNTLAASAQPVAQSRRGGSYSDPEAFCRAVRDADNDGEDISRLRKRGYTGPENTRIKLDGGGEQLVVWRCMDGRVTICAYGANPRHCQRNVNGLRPSAAVRRYCAQDPSGSVPGSANDTSLFWDCRAGQPVLSVPASLDRLGYNKQSWD